MAKTSPLSSLLSKASKLNYPLNAVFELTHRCNLKCLHCYVPAPAAELGTDRMKSIISELAEAGTLFLTLTGGEVLLRPDFFQLAGHARRRRLALKIFTNATMIDDDTARQLAALCPADIGVSLHGAGPESHDSFTRVRGSFDLAVAGIQALRAHGIKVHIKLVITNRNWREFQAVRSLAEGLDAAFSFSFDISPARDGGLEPLQYRVDDATLKHMLDDGYLYEEANRVPLTEVGGEDFSTVALCSAGRDQVAIAPDGRVMPCLLLPIEVGNLATTDFAQAWNGPPLTDIRNQRLADLHACSNCTELRFCRRCSGMALLEHGDMLGLSSWACRVASVNRELDNHNQVGGEVNVATL